MNKIAGDLGKIGKYWSLSSQDYYDCVQKELNDHEFLTSMGKIIDYHAPENDNCKILDMGCGPGFFPVFFGKKGHKINAIDYSKKMIEQAKKNCDENNVEVNIEQMNALDMKYKDGSFDLIVSRNMMWTTPDPLKVYSEMVRLLKSGGRLVIFDGNFCLRYHYEDYKKLGIWWGEREDNVTRDKIEIEFDEVSFNLPSGHLFRPEWDLKTLLDLGMNDFKINIERRDIIDGEKKESLVTDFIISAGKP